MSRKLFVLLATVVSSLAIAISSPVVASASATCNDCVTGSTSATYHGPGTISNCGFMCQSTAPAFWWNANSRTWSSYTLPTRAHVTVYPYAKDWRWIWYNGYWFAIHEVYVQAG